ncbi:hypothetical protein Tco_1564395 [Tanacetum coccineum]
MLKSPSTFPIPVEDSDSFFKKFDTSLSYSDNSLPEFETFSDHTEKTNSGSTTTHADNSLPEYDSFLFETGPDQGELTSVVMGEPRVYVPTVLPTHTTLMLNSNFIPSDDSLGSDLGVYFPSRTRNKIFDPGIFFEDNIFNPGILASNEEKSLHLLSHRGFKAFQLIYDISKSPTMIYGEDIPILDVPFLHFYPP